MRYLQDRQKALARLRDRGNIGDTLGQINILALAEAKKLVENRALVTATGEDKGHLAHDVARSLMIDAVFGN